jgi:hypothetical protein
LFGRVEPSSSIANVNQLLAAAEKLCRALRLGAARASLAHSAAHFRYMREEAVECIGAQYDLSLPPIENRSCPLQDDQSAIEIAQLWVNQRDALASPEQKFA